MSKTITHVGELRALLNGIPDNAPILCQVVGAESGVWNVFLEGGKGAECGFKWDVDPIILQMKHPDMKVLPV